MHSRIHSLLVGAILSLFGSASCYSNEPLFVVQSASTSRLFSAIDSLGLPDPLAGAGLDTASTLELLQDAIRIDATSGGFVFLSDDRPHLIVCLPLVRLQKFLDVLTAFAGSKFERESDGVYRLGEKGKFFAIPSNGYLLLADSRHFLDDAARDLSEHPWGVVNDDIRIQANLFSLPSIQRSVLLREALSLLNSKPTTPLLLNLDSLKEHFAAGMQRYLVTSLFECKSFDLHLNKKLDGILSIQIQTIESTSDIRVPSQFRLRDNSNAVVSVDFATKLSPETTRSTTEWARSTEQQILKVIESVQIADRSDLERTKTILRCVSELIQLSVTNQKVDGVFSFGKTEEESFALGAIAVSDEARLAGLLNTALESSKSWGVNYRDLRTKDDRNSPKVDAQLEIPSSVLETLGLPKLGRGDLKIQLLNGILSVGIGQQSEPLGLQSIVVPNDATTKPIAITLDVDAGREFGLSKKGWPIPFDKLKLNVVVGDEGRYYDLELNGAKAADLLSTASSSLQPKPQE